MNDVPGATGKPPRTRVVLGEAAARRPVQEPARRLIPEPSRRPGSDPHRRAGSDPARRFAYDPARADLAEQTPVGEALVKGLVRAQLALAIRLSLVVAAGLGALPLLFAVAPAVGQAKVFGVNLPWVLLGFLSFPFLVVVGAAYVRWAERNEQDFTAVIRRPEG
ncbi:hypothetical protein AB0M36_18980 [Actinoplanes sp. NPDC051346]|uniref:DUF485 domain-containing protein n=1 Tax=Actinoplanes sp. NPDC051346 TaxID=3155048 RepID=UPI00342A9155